MKKFFRTWFPPFSLAFFGIGLAGGLLLLLSMTGPGAGDFLNRTVGHATRFLLAKVTSLFPFSLAEVLVCLSPLIIGLIVFFGIRSLRDRRRAVRYFCGFLSVLVLLFASFPFTLGFAYHGSTLEEKLGLSDEEVSAEQLENTYLLLREQVNALGGGWETAEDNSSVMPYGVGELSQKLVAAYDTFCEEYPIFRNFYSLGKAVHFSVALSQIHLLGIYSCPTGESNINTEYPDYSLPFTLAHEFAHQRGIARENEANFVAFLVCIGSEDPYIRYSGYLNMCQYVGNALYRADPDRYRAAYAGLAPDAVAELRAYNATYSKYSSSKIGEVSDKLNDAYLQWNGTEGTASYGLVVDLTVAYYEKKAAETP